jgi:hypothetical protein
MPTTSFPFYRLMQLIVMSPIPMPNSRFLTDLFGRSSPPACCCCCCCPCSDCCFSAPTFPPCIRCTVSPSARCQKLHDFAGKPIPLYKAGWPGLSAWKKRNLSFSLLKSHPPTFLLFFASNLHADKLKIVSLKRQTILMRTGSQPYMLMSWRRM